MPVFLTFQVSKSLSLVKLMINLQASVKSTKWHPVKSREQYKLLYLENADIGSRKTHVPEWLIHIENEMFSFTFKIRTDNTEHSALTEHSTAMIFSN